MKRALALGAILVGACSSPNLSPDTVRGALPQAASTQISAPTATGGTAAVRGLGAGGDLVPASAVGDVSGYFVSTVTLAVAVNGSVAWSLGVLEAVVALPPTSCKEDGCTWGPGSHPLDPRDWKLTVTKVGDRFDYELAGQLKSAPTGFVTVLSGQAWPGGAPHRGHGSFFVDHEAGRALGFTDTGTLEVTYDNRTDLAIGATLLGFTDASAPYHVGNAVYAYAEGPTGGDLQVAFHDLTSTADPRLALHSRWAFDGAGRGDAAYSQAAPAASYTAAECWSPATTAPPFRVVFYLDSAGATSGAEASCAFAPGEPPTLTAP